MTLTLGELASRVPGATVHGDAARPVGGVTSDSRAVVPGDLFVALAGERTDGARFVADAIARGAVAIGTAAFRRELGVPQIVLADPRAALAPLAEYAYGQPTRALRVIGVTGTNGKTTTTWLLDEALSALGARPALLGTVETRGPGFREPSALTTPQADAVSRVARRALDAGASHLVMEVSSHALAQGRVEAVRFAVAAFTNLTQDHLDFHGTMEAYFEAKARLFFDLRPGAVVLNVDDAHGRALAARLTSGGPPLFTVSCDPASTADVHPARLTLGRSGISLDAVTPRGPISIESPLLGAHNVENLLVATGCLLALSVTDARDLTPEAIGRALSAARGAPGRLERVPDPRDVAVLVDYAHSPDALAKALDALRPLTPGRLVCVFGCGGDRDRTKRPRMGQAAAERADLVVVTSDNPRTEVPAAIVAEIVPGVVGAGAPSVAASELASAARGHVVEVDRRRAIRLALAAARPGDTVLVAGKGHEDYQIIGTAKTHFDDREEARAAIALACGEAA